VHHGDGGGRSRPSAVRAAWTLGDDGAVFNLASFDGLDVDAVRFEARTAHEPVCLRTADPPRLGGWKSLHRDRSHL